MSRFDSPRRRGFTLVELMIVVAIIGVLAALAVYGVRSYLVNAKSSEAKHTIGAISRAAVSAYERENMTAQLLSVGTYSSTAAHSLCGTSIQVPASAPLGKKYQPKTAKGQDFDSGDARTGWKCLRFELTEATYFSYRYVASGTLSMTAAGVALPTAAGANWWTAATADLDGNGVNSVFALPGAIRNNRPTVSTAVREVQPGE